MLNTHSLSHTLHPGALIAIFSTLHRSKKVIYHPNAIREPNLHMLTSPRKPADMTNGP